MFYLILFLWFPVDQWTKRPISSLFEADLFRFNLITDTKETVRRSGGTKTILKHLKPESLPHWSKYKTTFFMCCCSSPSLTVRSRLRLLKQTLSCDYLQQEPAGGEAADLIDSPFTGWDGAHIMSLTLWPSDRCLPYLKANLWDSLLCLASSIAA